VPEGGGTSGEKGVTEALRAAIEGTLSEASKRARTGSAALRPERATQLLDEVARRGQRAREGLTRRGQGAREELTRRGKGARDELTGRRQEAREQVTVRLDALERRLARLEDALRKKPKPKAED
jgi:polyhydroxyalkanoate synthesis regulator phasin